MKALIAFIVMAIAILTLIEINERRKAKKSRDLETSISLDPKDCKDQQACSECGLVDLCEKKSTAAQ